MKTIKILHGEESVNADVRVEEIAEFAIKNFRLPIREYKVIEEEEGKIYRVCKIKIT